MVRVISQDTYDETVRLNMEEFSMSAQEAIEETIKEFEAQGVDLSNIIKDLALSDESESLLGCLTKVKEKLKEKDLSELEALLDKIRTELNKDLARKVYASEHGAYTIFIDLLSQCKNDHSILRAGLKAVTALMSGNPDLLDKRGIDLQIELLDKLNNIPTRQYLLRWIKECCIKHEMNRQNIFEAGILDKLKNSFVREDASGNEVRDACAVLRALCLDDDIRHEFGKAHEHATQIAKACLQIITGLLQKFKTDKAVIGDLIFTLATLIVRNEFCQDVEDAGGLKFILDVMTDYPDVEKLNWQTLKLLKALAGNDNVKCHIVTSGSAPLIVSAINRLKSSESVVTAGLGCIAALTLRSPSNAGVFYDCGAPSVVVDVIKSYPKSVKVLKNASWVIRNMSVRNKIESQEFITLGVEEHLTKAIETHGAALDHDVKSALRDLGLKVELKERWTGKGGALTNK